MPNIIISINGETYNKMKSYSEIKWSDFVRVCIQKRIDKLEKLRNHSNREGIFTMLSSEDVLKKDWNNEADEMWNNV